MTLQDYYNDLRGFLEKNTMLWHLLTEDPETENERSCMDYEVVPLMAFVLASKPHIHNRIDKLYENVLKQIPKNTDVSEQYGKIDVPELERCLSPEARLIYKKMLVICMGEGTDLIKQLVKLLKRAYPRSYIDKEEVFTLVLHLRFGAFDIKDSVVTYLSMYLNNIQVPTHTEDDFGERTWLEFKATVLENIPLPFWCGYEPEVLAQKSFNLLETAQKGFEFLDFCYQNNRKACEPIMEKRTQIQPLRVLNTEQISIESLIGDNDPYTKDMQRTISNAGKHPCIKERMEKRISEESDMISWVLKCLSNTYVSREELLSTTVPDHVIRWANQAYREQYDEENNAPDVYKLIAGLLFVLSDRAANAEEAVIRLVEKHTENSKEDLSEEVIQKEDKPENETIKQLQQELTEVRRKNKELSFQLSEWKEQSGKERKREKCEYENLKQEYETLKEQFEQLIAAEEQDGNTEEIIEEEKLETMKQLIQQHKVMFIGGHGTWQNAMRAEFPRCRFIDPEDNTTIVPGIFKGIDYIVYNVKWNNHCIYNKCLSMKQKYTRLIFLNTNNVARTIAVIYEYISKEEYANVV